MKHKIESENEVKDLTPPPIPEVIKTSEPAINNITPNDDHNLKTAVSHEIIESEIDDAGIIFEQLEEEKLKYYGKFNYDFTHMGNFIYICLR